MAVRKSIPKKDQLRVWKRDNWHCRYCNVPVFFNPVLKLFNELNPGHQYYHRNGKTGELIPLFQWQPATVDHVVPVKSGGRNEMDNYVTACWQCNLDYRDKQIGKPPPGEIIKSSWDGFSGLYARLVTDKTNDWLRIIKE